ncbi:MAG: cobalamin biosynthesis protein CobD [Solirubrobacterales bacterium]|nr:cobalamin biosynthesis protein CobD [Solirubrobacterales bacterium]
MSVALLSGYAADVAFGDPRRGHPVAGFGNATIALESKVYAPTKLRGALFAFGLIASAGVAVDVLANVTARRRSAGTAVFVAVTWASLGGRSLAIAAGRVADALKREDIEAARNCLPSLVGRDVSGMDAEKICRAVVESVAENTSDAVVGALFWGALFGPAGVTVFRAANTLDAMVGHRSDRYEDFGWAAARIDDALGWPAARLTALLAAVCAPVVDGSARESLRILRRDGGSHPSPNAGRVEAAFAGALNLKLGGPLSYDGQDEVRGCLGDGTAPRVQDIDRSVRLASAVGLTALAICCAIRVARGRWRSA